MDLGEEAWVSLGVEIRDGFDRAGVRPYHTGAGPDANRHVFEILALLVVHPARVLLEIGCLYYGHPNCLEVSFSLRDAPPLDSMHLAILRQLE